MWNSIVSVPYRCLFIYFDQAEDQIQFPRVVIKQVIMPDTSARLAVSVTIK